MAEPVTPTSSSSSSDAQPEAAVPQRIGRFRLVKPLGQGAMGAVWLAEDMTLKRPVAVKMLPHGVQDEVGRKHVEKFIREAQAAARIVHPNVVQVFEVGLANGQPFFAMEVVDGGNLHEQVKQQGTMDYHRAAELVWQAAEGLAQAHELGVIHRDIKPANLMLTRRGHCKIGDFGVAVMENVGDQPGAAQAVGTPYYMAPEAARGKYSPASDTFALGGVLCFLLTGRPPFALKKPKDVLQIHSEFPLADIRHQRPDVPEALVSLIEKALAYAPEDRFTSAEALADAIKPFAMGGHADTPFVPALSDEVAELAAATAGLSRTRSSLSATAGGTMGTSRQTGEGTSRKPLFIGLAVVAVLLIVGGVVAVVMTANNGAQPKPGSDRIVADRGNAEPEPSTDVWPPPVTVPPEPEVPAMDPSGTPEATTEQPLLDIVNDPAAVTDPLKPKVEPEPDPEPTPTPAQPAEPPTVLHAERDLVTLARAIDDGKTYMVYATVHGAPNKSGSTWRATLGSSGDRSQACVLTFSDSLSKALCDHLNLSTPHHLNGTTLVITSAIHESREKSPELRVSELKQVRRVVLPDPLVLREADRQVLEDAMHLGEVVQVVGKLRKPTDGDPDIVRGRHRQIRFEQGRQYEGLYVAVPDARVNQLKGQWGSEDRMDNQHGWFRGKIERPNADGPYVLVVKQADDIKKVPANWKPGDDGKTSASDPTPPKTPKLPPAEAIDLNDRNALAEAAKADEDKRFAVTGMVRGTQTVRVEGKPALRIHLTTATNFHLLCQDAGVLTRLVADWGERGANLRGRTITITGRIEQVPGTSPPVPFIRLTDLAQLEVAD